MAYKAKNTAIPLAKASAAKADTESRLDSTLRSFDRFKLENKKLAEMQVSNEKMQTKADILAPYAQMQADDKAEDLTKYNKWKGQFDELVNKKESSDFTFPEFDDWHDNRTKATIGDTEWSYSDMNMAKINPEKLNDMLEMIKAQYGSE